MAFKKTKIHHDIIHEHPLKATNWNIKYVFPNIFLGTVFKRVKHD